MLRAGLGLAASACLAFAVYLLIAGLARPGVALGVALIVMQTIAGAFGFVQGGNAEKAGDVRRAGWAAIVLAVVMLVCIFTFYKKFTLAALVWIIFQFPLAVALVATRGERSGR